MKKANCFKQILAFILCFAMAAGYISYDGLTVYAEETQNVGSQDMVIVKEEKVSDYTEDDYGISSVDHNLNTASSFNETSVYNALISMKSTYPEGMTWTNANSYSPYYHYREDGVRVTYTGYGCAGFVFHLSNAAFGYAEDREHKDWDNIRVGDILRVNNDSHSVIVLSVSGDTITVAEGNYNSSIHWGRQISRASLKNGAGTYIWTHWPANSSSSSSSSTSSSATTSNPTTVYNGVDYSAVYNFNYYINKYSDIKKAYGSNPTGALSHFVNNGMKEGRQASSEFNVTYYKNRYADLRNAYGTDLKKYYIHYINAGKKEGRDAKTYCAEPKTTSSSTTASSTTTSKSTGTTILNGVNYSAVYNYSYYVNKYPDIKKAFGNDDVKALQHFVNCGMKEGRQGISTFNVYSYAYAYADLRKVYKNDLKKYYLHYMNAGKKEGRKATGVTSMKNTATTYNGVNYSLVYDYTYYTTKYADIKKAYGLDDTGALAHFVNCGMKEGRQAKSTFNVQKYKSRYADLQKAYGSDLKKYYIHYINAGKKEGRKAN
ncbi:MAG: hypothetical protein IJ167_06180 [Lachnospiraceae bacterium]|nr:hypothetical protein [Lachnospiraceae bacterium]